MSGKRDVEKSKPIRPLSTAGTEDTVSEPRDWSTGDQSLEEGNIREMGYAFVDLIVEYLKEMEATDNAPGDKDAGRGQ